MKTKMYALMALVFFLLLGLTGSVKSASLVVQNMTSSEFNGIESSKTALTVYFRGGVSGIGFGDEEIRMALNTTTPAVGGGSGTLIGQVTWGNPSQIGLNIDELGYVSAFAQSTIVQDQGFAMTRFWNALAIQNYDHSIFTSSSLLSIKVNGVEVRNLFADGFGENTQTDSVLVTGFTPNQPLEITATWDKGSAPAFDDQSITLKLYNIPEPNTFMLLFTSSLLVLWRKR